MDEIQQGEILRGRVSEVADFGVFVDLGGREGMITLLEISWSRLEHPSRAVRQGQEVTVLALGVDHRTELVKLSLKALTPDPMRVFAADKLGQVVLGHITETNEVGTFASIGEGLEGLITSFPASTDKQNLRQGDEVRVRVLSMNAYTRQIRLAVLDESE
ncbi:S1 RNA-binding domain-containing protein [Streptomyces capparidis]